MIRCLIALLLCAVHVSAQVYHTPAPVKGKRGLEAAVVSAHPLATAAGVYMLSLGGNAFDAAIATQLALAVVYPRAGNLGGGGFLVTRLKEDVAFTIDFRETAPASAHATMYINTLSGKADTAGSLNGPAAAGVPGTVAGLMETFRYAQLPFDTLIAPAIRMALQGFCITKNEAEKLNANRDFFLKNNGETPLFVKAEPWKEGDTLRQPELAQTLLRIRQEGAGGFYQGHTAQLIVEEMKRGAGFITEKDLAGYRVRLREPLRFDYKEYSFITMSLPSSGGMIMHQVLTMMRILESKYGKAANPLQFYQRFIEAERRAFADRSRWPGDPDLVTVPLDTLLSEHYLTERVAAYDPHKAGNSAAIEPGVVESEETTHLSVVDALGNAVAVTTTLNGNYGCKTAVQGAGFLLNNEMDDFSIQPGVANQFGAVGGMANAIAPGKRMLSSMSPAIVLKQGKLFAVLGAPGGTTIPSSVLLTFLSMAEWGESPEKAVEVPRLHHQWWPDVVYVEQAFSPQWEQELQRMGYVVKRRSPFGSIDMVCAEPGNTWKAVADPRGDDDAGGILKKPAGKR